MAGTKRAGAPGLEGLACGRQQPRRRGDTPPPTLSPPTSTLWTRRPGHGQRHQGVVEARKAREAPHGRGGCGQARRETAARALPLAPAAVVEEHCRRARAVAAPSLIPPLLRSHWRLRVQLASWRAATGRVRPRVDAR